jgi:hypothetical protein
VSVGTDQYTPDHVASEASQHKRGLPCIRWLRSSIPYESTTVLVPEWQEIVMSCFLLDLAVKTLESCRDLLSGSPRCQVIYILFTVGFWEAPPPLYRR